MPQAPTPLPRGGVFSFALLAAAALLCAPATAIAGDVTLRGVTTTQGGAVYLPGVVLALTDVRAARLPATTTSDETGHFVFAPVAPGEYEIVASLAGFENGKRRVRVAEDQPAEIAIDLAVARLSENVQVTDRTPRAVPTPVGNAAAGSALTTTPLRGDSYQALVAILPGVVRDGGGRLRLAGGGATQAALQMNGASLTDPSTNDFAFELPGDAVESVKMIDNPFSPEYGRFTSGLTVISTRRGGNRWQIVPNGFIPRLRMDLGERLDIASFTPRLTISGPIVQDRVFLSEHVQYRVQRASVPSLTGDPTTEARSFDGYTRVDAKLAPRHDLVGSFALYPHVIRGVNMSTFNPPESTATMRQSGFNAGVSHRATLSASALVETTFNVKQHDVDVEGRGLAPLQLTPFGAGGNYFNRQSRVTRNVQATSVLTYSPNPRRGTHVFRAGVDVLSASFSGTSANQPIEIVRTDGTLSELITFLRPTGQVGAGTDIGAFVQDHWKPTERLQVEFGSRLDRDAVLGSVNVSPRSSFALALNAEASAVLRGGYGWFYERTPLTVGAFESMDARVVTSFAADGTTTVSSTRFSPVAGPLSVPRAVIANLEYDQRVNRRLTFRVNLLHRDGRNEIIVEPALQPVPALLLTSGGTSQYWQGEFTVRYAADARTRLTATYVRSQSRANLNGFDGYFGNLRIPVIVPDQYSVTNADLPHRLVVVGTLGLPAGLQLAPVVEIRSGFPYTVVDGKQQPVGGRNLGGRFPTLATFDLALQRPVRVGRYQARVGVRIYNAFNHFNPRDVMNNITSPAFGNFYNPIPRSIGLDLWIDGRLPPGRRAR